MRIAVFGQAAFGRDVLTGLLDAGHEVVGVYAPPAGARPDPLTQEAELRGLRLLRHKSFRSKGQARPERVEEYLTLGAELNVLPFTTVILPPEIVEAPSHGSLCFHPSLLPRFRGGAAIAWQIILGERETGVTVFRPDAGVDTGPILVQKGGVTIEDTDNAASLYFDKLYPLGVEAMREAVALVAEGRAGYRPQNESEASFQGLVDEDAARIDWERPGAELGRLVRGCDPQPGAHALRGGALVRLFGGAFEAGPTAAPPGTLLSVETDRLEIAVHGGRLSIAKVRVGNAPKSPAAEAGLAAGERLR